MIRQSVSLLDTPLLSKASKALVARDTSILPFIRDFADEKSTAKYLNTRVFNDTLRKTLANCLETQYKGKAADQVLEKIELLKKPNTFTVTTGHQLNIFTGPAYFIYKIAHTIALAKTMQSAYPDKNIVPIYWMASEDHDFEEINHFFSEKEKHSWDIQARGPVGVLATEGLEALSSVFKDNHGVSKEKYLYAVEAALRETNLADFTRTLVDALFGKYGLVVLDASVPELKKAFIPYLERELFEELAFDACTKQNSALEKLGYPIQVNPREINLFYIEEGVRERIERTPSGNFTSGNAQQWSPSEVKTLLHQHPERFSPNVVTRPLYQECILPNICYIGGPGEMSYWLQLKSVFDAFALPFPLLLPRHSVLIIQPRERDQMEEAGFELQHLFEDKEQLIKQWLINNVHEDESFTLAREKLSAVYSDLEAHLEALDPSLRGRVEATKTRHLKDIDGLEKSALKALKQREDVNLSRIRKVMDKVWPDGEFQERHSNFILMTMGFEEDLIDELINGFDAYNPGLSLHPAGVPREGSRN